jgi:hypothetical protein
MHLAKSRFLVAIETEPIRSSLARIITTDAVVVVASSGRASGRDIPRAPLWWTQLCQALACRANLRLRSHLFNSLLAGHTVGRLEATEVKDGTSCQRSASLTGGSMPTLR